MPYTVTNLCIQCGACISGCASDAISEGENQVYIDPALCIECGTCASNCPSGAIEFVEDVGISRQGIQFSQDTPNKN
jgi:ferredoxin